MPASHAREALLYNALSGLAAVVGGVLGYFVVGPWEALFPYLLVVAASSFIYVAVADLLPQLQRRLPLRETLAQIAWIGAGLGMALRDAGLARALTAAGARAAGYLTTSTGSVLCVSTAGSRCPAAAR